MGQFISSSAASANYAQQAAYSRAYGIERYTAAQAHIATHQMQTMRQNQTAATSVTKLTFALRRPPKSRLTLQAPQPVALEKGKRLRLRPSVSAETSQQNEPFAWPTPSGRSKCSTPDNSAPLRTFA